MTTNRLIAVLVALTLGMQVAILFKQYAGTPPRPMREAPVRDAPKNSVIELKGLPVKGSKNARVALIEFSDYECPFCERHANGVGKEIDKEFVSTGRILHVFVNNPLPMHGKAKFLATSAICGGDQSRYWEMHDAIFAKKPRNKEQSLAVARELGLEVREFEQCLENGPEPFERIEEDLQLAKRLGLNATPAFAVGPVDSSRRVSVQKLISGALPRDIFEKTLNEALLKANAYER